MKITKKLSSFVIEKKYGDFPDSAISQAKRCILDGLGTTLSGSIHPGTKILTDFIKGQGRSDEATILGSGYKTSMANAALINGMMCHVMDYDDTSWVMRGHPTAVLLPAILAIAESTHAKGKNILTSFILGFEVACKIGEAVNPSNYDLGFHSTSTIGIFGATAAVGSLLGLDQGRLSHAFGIAGSRSSGLRENFGTMTKALHVGMAAHDAIFSVMLAQRGFTASTEILEGDRGFGKVMSKSSNFDQIIGKLGNPFDIVERGVVVKKYPSCARTHTALDAFFFLKEKFKFKKYDDITLINCGTDKQAFNILKYPEPKNSLEAKFSIPFCLSVAALEGKAGLDQFTDEMVNNPKIISFFKKINHYPEQEIIDKGYEFRGAAKITIEFKNGKTLTHFVEKAKGNPENPLSDKELRDKFKDCAKWILPQEKTKRIFRIIDEFDKLEDIKELIDNLIVEK